MRVPDLLIERVAPTHPDAVRLVEEVQQEYVARYGGRDSTPLHPEDFADPTGAFFLGHVLGPEGPVAVATGAWRLRSDVVAFGTGRTAEIKRMYVVPTARGRGHARTMLAHLERTAAAAGAEAMVLETGTKQPEALALYASAGYLPIPGFGHYKDHPGNRCLGRPLR